LDSVYNCNLPENRFEVLCVNDCSPDNTQEILELNQKKHSNLKIVMHECNKGLGCARNTGIREAKGKFLWFVDADDFITAPRLGELLEMVYEQELDVLCFNYRHVDNNGKERKTFLVFQEMPVQDGYSFTKTTFGYCGMGCVWRFLYRTEYLKSRKLFFPEKVIWEDYAYTAKAILKSDRIAAIPDVLYSYRVTPVSITRTFLRTYYAKGIYDSVLLASQELLSFSDEIEDEMLRVAFRKMAIHRMNSVGRHLYLSKKEECKKFYQLMKEKRQEIKGIKCHLNVMNRVLLLPIIGYWITIICFPIYRNIEMYRSKK